MMVCESHTIEPQVLGHLTLRLHLGFLIVLGLLVLVELLVLGPPVLGVDLVEPEAALVPAVELKNYKTFS